MGTTYVRLFFLVCGLDLITLFRQAAFDFGPPLFLSFLASEVQIFLKPVIEFGFLFPRDRVKLPSDVGQAYLSCR